MPEPAPQGRAAVAPARATWQSGDFRRLAAATLVVAELLCDAVPVRAGTKVLDVATGTGNVALAAARRRATATGVDIVPELLATAKQRASFEGLELDLRPAAMEKLPFEDASFDVALSTFGVMFSDTPERAARELARVVRPGGQVGLASWTPESFYGRIFAAIRERVPGAAGLGETGLWGTRAGVERLLGPTAERLEFHDRRILVRSDSPEAFAGFLLRFFAPLVRAIDTAPKPVAALLPGVVLELVREGQSGPGPDLLLPVPYLEVVAKRSGGTAGATPRPPAAGA